MFRFDRDSKMGQVGSGNTHAPMIGIVTDNVHPQGDYRVRVKFPTLPKPKDGEEQSFWCRISTMGAGSGGKGAFWLPEKDDEVLIIFMNGDFNQGVIIGNLWNGVDKPAFSNKDASSPTKRYNSDGAKFRGDAEAKKNDIRSFSTRSKHELIFNDNKDNPRVTLQSGCNHRIVLADDGNEPNRIEIYDGKEENYVLIDTKNKKITIETKTGDILIKAKEKVRIEAKNIETDSEEKTSCHAGTNYEIKADQNVKIEAGQQMDLKAGSALNEKAAVINLN